MQVILLRLFGIENLDWVLSTFKVQDRGSIEILRKQVNIHGSWHHNHLQKRIRMGNKYWTAFLQSRWLRPVSLPLWLTFSHVPEAPLKDSLVLKHSPHTLRGSFPSSFRLFCAAFTTPNSTSVWIVRSWASSKMTQLYFRSKESEIASRRSMPSVRNLILVSSEVTSSKRTV